MLNWNVVSVLLCASEKSMDRARGIIPRSTYRSAPPVMVKVLPDPVCPYANTVELYLFANECGGGRGGGHCISYFILGGNEWQHS
jgi:hypothetical protein